MICTRLGSGRWLRTSYRNVYRLAGHPVTWQHQAMAACLSRDGTVASHLTAAALFGLTAPPETPHVTGAVTTGARRQRAVVHRSPLSVGDRCVVQRIPATVPARTLVVCAQVLEAPGLMTVLDPALCRQLTTAAAVKRAARAVSPNGVRPGLAVLHEVLAVWTDGITPGSPAEMRLLRRIERWGFPLPEKQVEIRDGSGMLVARVDLAWADRVEKVDLLDGAERLRDVLIRLLAVAA